MEKQYYTVREVILGLRDEYVKNQARLDNLKKYFYIADKNVKSFNFETGNINEQQIIARFEKRGNIIQKLLSELLEEYTIESRETIYTLESSFYPKTLNINPSKLSEFKEEVNKIFGNVFLGKIGITPISLTGKDFDLSFWIDSKGIKLYKRNIMELETSLEYRASTDEIMVKSGTYSVSSANLMRLLEIKVPSMAFKNYHKELIEKQSKPLYLESFEPCLKTSLNFEEHTDRILLVKTY